MSHTVTRSSVMLFVSAQTYNEIRKAFEEAKYNHAIIDTPTGEVIDMNGIRIIIKPKVCYKHITAQPVKLLSCSECRVSWCPLCIIAMGQDPNRCIRCGTREGIEIARDDDSSLT